MISHFFIRRPIFAGVISIVIMLLGIFALMSLPVERYPNIAPPTISVSANYPGANAETVADTVAAPIEQEVNGVERMLYMSSVSANNGQMGLTVTFETGTDLDMANVLTQNRVSTAMAKLPQEVQRMGVTVKKKSTDSNLFISIYSDDGRYSDLFLSNYVTLQIKDELARVKGVGEVMTYGAGDYSMRLWLDPEKMRTRDVTADEVVQAVREQNLQVAAKSASLRFPRVSRSSIRSMSRGASSQKRSLVPLLSGLVREGVCCACAMWLLSSLEPRATPSSPA